MGHITTLVRGKILIAAGAIVLVGVLVIAWTFLAGSAETPALQSFEAQSDEGFELGDPGLNGEPAQSGRPEADPTPVIEYAIVHITGAVRHPEVYKLPSDARVKDVVLAAGGLTEDADIDRINLAAHITDAEKIHIPRLGEPTAIPPATGEGASNPSEGGLININTASAEDIASLEGIGQVIAQRIVDYRTENGPFQSIDDLQEVKGIGSALIEDIAPLITVGL